MRVLRGVDNLAPGARHKLAQCVSTGCEDDYLRKHADKNEKPEFYWLESNLFSGTNEQPFPHLPLCSAPRRKGTVLSTFMSNSRTGKLMKRMGDRPILPIPSNGT